MATAGRPTIRKGKKEKIKKPPAVPVEPITSAEPVLRPFHTKTANQGRYYHSILTNTLTFAVGCAGTGKTRVVARCIAEMLLSGQKERAIFTRPNEEAGTRMGPVPGDLNEKIGPYMAPLLREVYKEIGKQRTDALVRQGRIELLPIGFARGHNFDDAIAVLDEAQNATRTQMKLFLTRIGTNCTMVIDGDSDQIDIRACDSGLEDAIRRLADDPEVGVVRFTVSDIVRSGLVQRIVKSYAQPI